MGAGDARHNSEAESGSWAPACFVKPRKGLQQTFELRFRNAWSGVEDTDHGAAILDVAANLNGRLTMTPCVLEEVYQGSVYGKRLECQRRQFAEF